MMKNVIYCLSTFSMLLLFACTDDIVMEVPEGQKRPVVEGYFTDELNRRAGYDFVGTVFERAYFSCELKMRKPDPAIFKYIIEKHNLNPSETLFVDDCLKHIDSAKSVGLQTCFMPAENDISELILY